MVPVNFFVVGNKRSGTSLLARLLNLHPEIYCTHESDLAWLIHQAQQRNESPWKATEGGWEYSLDDPVGLRHTVRTLGKKFWQQADYSNPKEVFDKGTSLLMSLGDKVDAVKAKPEQVRFLGDKKPVQYADPVVRTWLDDEFEPLYLHSVRHPRNCISSMRETALIPWWNDDLREVTDQWARHEQWALSIPEENRFTYRYEDLVANPVGVMRALYARLGASQPSAMVRKKIRNSVLPQDNRTLVDIPYTKRAKEVMEIHGYGPKNVKERP